MTIGKLDDSRLHAAAALAAMTFSPVVPWNAAHEKENPKVTVTLYGHTG